MSCLGFCLCLRCLLLGFGRGLWLRLLFLWGFCREFRGRLPLVRWGLLLPRWGLLLRCRTTHEGSCALLGMIHGHGAGLCRLLLRPH